MEESNTLKTDPNSRQNISKSPFKTDKNSPMNEFKQKISSPSLYRVNSPT